VGSYGCDGEEIGGGERCYFPAVDEGVGEVDISGVEVLCLDSLGRN